MRITRRWPAVVSAVAFILGSASVASALQLSISTISSMPSVSCQGAFVSLEMLNDKVPPERRSRRVAVGVPGSASVDLPPGAWRATLEGGRHCWGNSRTIRLQTDAKQLQLAAWPAGAVTGQLVAPPGSRLPKELLLTFAPAHRLRQGGEPQGREPCVVEGNGAFRCAAPAARLDLRLSTTGYAASYSWNADLTRTKRLTLGQLRLVPGASLGGWLATADGRALPKTMRIRAAPRGLSQPVGPHEGRLLSLTTIEGKSRSDGFFQITGLQGGHYEVSIQAAGFAEAEAVAVVTAGRESQLRDPILLSPPLKLSVVLTPPVAPNGRAWRVLLGATDRFRSHLRPIAETTVPTNGWFEKGGLNAGPYLVKVVASNGAGWAAREIELGSEPMPITIELGAVKVRGRVTLGSDPLASATVIFGGRFGAEKVEARTDRDGEYEALLPRAGSWKVDLTASDPVVNRRFASLDVPTPKGNKPSVLDIELADTTLSGELRMRDGSPIDKAAVRLWPLRDGLWGAKVDHRVEGDRFLVRGLAEGSYFVNADRAGARAASQLVTLSDGGRQHVVLVLDRFDKVTGRVVSEGLPVSGALVILQPTQDWAFVPPQARTDAEGHFKYELPQQTREVVAHVAAPGRSYAAMRAPVTGQGLVFELPEQGGDLTLDLPTGINDPGADSVLVVFRDGAPLERGTLHTWASIQPSEGDGSGAGTLVARSLAGGRYEACNVPKARFAGWMQGMRDPARCASGELSVMGSLRLRVPRGE